MEQQELSRILRQNPQRGLEQVLQKYGCLMYAVALNILRNPQDAEDAVSEALIRIWKKHKELKKDTALRNYVCAITRNCAIDLLRSRQKRMEQSLEEELESTLIASDDLIQKLDSGIILQQLKSLGEPTCSIFLRRYWNCESVEEIAGALHLSRGAVESRMHRGKKQLKELLTQGGFADEDQ